MEPPGCLYPMLKRSGRRLARIRIRNRKRVFEIISVGCDADSQPTPACGFGPRGP